MIDESKSLISNRRPLHLALWSALIPGALGLGSPAFWLAIGGRLEDVGPFYLAGIVAIGLGVILFPVGCGAVVVARRRGAASRAVALRCALLLANVPLAAACWGVGEFLADLQIVRIANDSSVAVGPVRLWIEPELAPKHVLEIERLNPGETRTWVLHYSNEGTATFRCTQGERTIEPKRDEPVFLGIGQPMEVEIHIADNGAYTINGQFARRWSWLAHWEFLRNDDITAQSQTPEFVRLEWG
jgi:hypothetical protein